MMKIIAFFALVFSLTEASTPFTFLGVERRDANRCSNFIRQCVTPLTQYGEFLEGLQQSNGAVRLDNTVLDRLCGDLQDFMTCSRNSMRACNSRELTNQLSAVGDIIDYMCSAEGRQTVMQMSTSPCAANDTITNQLQEVLQGCLDTFQEEIWNYVIRVQTEGAPSDPSSQLCPLLDAYRVCTIDNTRRLCGGAYATFVNKVWEIMMSQQFVTQSINCPEIARSTRSILAHAVQLTKRRK